MSGLIIKIIATIAMTCDHIYYPFFENLPILRIIGRIAFPLYILLLVEGFKHTKDDSKKFLSYFFRLVLIGIISVIPMNLAFNGTASFDLQMSIFLTLIICLGMLYTFEFVHKYNKIASYLVVILFTIISYYADGDYSLIGVPLTFCIYKYRQNKKVFPFIISFVLVLLFNTLLNTFINNQSLSFDLIAHYYKNAFPLEEFAVLSIPIIILYNGKKGYNNKFIQYAFYLYYPIHLLCIYFLKIVCGYQ